MEVTLEQLQSSLQDVSSGVYNGRESDLFQAIESAKPQLLNLLDSGPKSAAERSAVKDGPGIMRDGRLYKPNAAAAERIIFLSDHLNTSETYCAGLMDRVVLQQPNLTPVTHVEIATREYYSVRDTILAIWKLLLNILVATNQPEQEVEVAAGSLGWHLAAKTKELIKEGQPESLLNRILSQIDEAAKRVEEVKKKLVDATSQTNTGVSLRHDVLEGEISKLLEQRRELGDLLILLCRTKELSADETLHLIQWTSKLKSSDDLIIHVSAASLLALSPTTSPTNTAVSYLGDKDLLTGLLSKFDATTEWEAKGMRAAIQLECALFLVACRARDPTLCDEVNATVDEVEYLATQAMESDAFKFLSHVILSARGRDSAVSDKGSIVAVADIPQATEGYELINPEIRSHVYNVIESTIINLLASLPNVLKKLKHKQEDVGIVARKPPLPFANTLGRIPEPSNTTTAHTQRSDIASLFRLVGTLYDALPPESALKFWTVQPSKTRQIDSINSRLPSFVRWATESRGEVMVPAVYDMLAGLAKGTSCSEHAYNYLSTGGVSANTLAGMQASYGGGSFSWSTLFGSLGFYSESLPNPRSIQQYRQQGPLPEIRVEEANLLVSFLKLLKVVAQWSVPARLALAEHGQYRAVPAMLQLATCRIPLELKGAIYDAVAAFCSPGGGPTGSAICRNTWLMLEQLQVLDTQSVPTGVGSSHGIKFELLEVEMMSKVYPCTSSFIRLMNSLIHTPKDLSLKQTLFGSQGGQTVPDGLGAPQRTLPLTPYISFVVDDILFLGEEHFKTEAERWSLKDMCLQFLEKSLASYELEALPATLQNVAAQGPLILRPWLAHAGFDILNRLFSETRLRALLNDFIAEGPNKLEKNAIKTKYFESCMRRIIRIIHRTLDIQSYFLDMLVPTIQSFDFTSILHNFAPGQLISLDRHFLFNHVLVERVALLVTLRDQEMQLLAIRILGMLALSPHFTVMDQQASRTARKLNRLAVIIQNSDDSLRINEGFAELLANDFAESENLDEIEAHIGAGTPDRDEEEDEVSLAYLIRLEIANLLLKNTEKGRPAPNLAHLILGFDVTTASKNELTIQDPNALNSSRSCFHVITELLSEGIPFLDPSRKRREERLLKRTPLYCKAPLLAEKFHRLVYQLCSHDLTSKPTARYLRTREDYFARNLSALPIRAPGLPFGAEGIASYSDGMSVDSNCRSLTSFLRMRAWLLDSIALELHLLTDERQFPRAGRILDILFSGIDNSIESFGDDVEEEFFGGSMPVFAPGQSLMRVLEIFQSFDIVWQDSTVSSDDVQLIFFSSLDYSSCLRTTENGTEVIDRDSLVNLLSNIRKAKQELENSTPEGPIQVSKEVRYLLESCVRENNRREIEHAKAMGYESWRRVVNISLSKCFERLPSDSREGILFDLLQEVPPVIRRAALDLSSAVLLSEVTVMLITKLREDRSNRILLESLTQDENTAASLLPEDRFHAILKTLLETILTPGMPEVVRGNLYASIINHLQLVHTIVAAKKEETPLDEDLEEEPLFGTSKAIQKWSSVEVGCINIINSMAERIIPVLCRDAVDGSEVWKSVTFILLDSLVRISRIQRQHRILHLLAKGGYLSNFCVGFKEADEDLQAVAALDPVSFNVLYVHESKMSFLIRIAQTRIGAEQLLAARVVTVLSQCDFIDSRPDANQSLADLDSQLFLALERWHQLIKPAFQLVCSILASSGPSSAEAQRQALNFVVSHRETLRALLQESGRMSLSHLTELPLIITLCTYVVPIVSKNDLTSRSSGFGPLHEVLMNLCAKTIFTGRWGAVVTPSNDNELAESKTTPAAFQAKILEATEELQRMMLTYMIVASDATSPQLTVVLSSNLYVPKEGDLSLQQPGSMPTVGDAIVAIRDIQTHLNQSLIEINSYSVKILNQDITDMDELEEIALSSLDGIERLEPHQKRALAFAQLKEMMQQRISDSVQYMNALEMLLLLLWRHVDHYINAWAVNAAGPQKESGPAKMTEEEFGQTIRPALAESRSGWGLSLFSPFRRKAESPHGADGTPLASSQLIGTMGQGGEAAKAANSRSVLTISALGGRGLQSKSVEENQAEAFRVEVGAVVEPILDKLEALQLPDDIPSLDFRVRGPYIHSFVKRIRSLINPNVENGGKDDDE